MNGGKNRKEVGAVGAIVAVGAVVAIGTIGAVVLIGDCKCCYAVARRGFARGISQRNFAFFLRCSAL